MLQQLSIYAENKKGTMQNITEVLADENINIWGSCTNDGAEYGINRMVVSDPQRAMEALEAVGVEVEDEVGNLNKLLKALAESNININYIYLSFNRASGKPVLVFQTADTAEVEVCLKNKGFSVV